MVAAVVEVAVAVVAIEDNKSTTNILLTIAIEVCSRSGHAGGDSGGTSSTGYWVQGGSVDMEHGDVYIEYR